MNYEPYVDESDPAYAQRLVMEMCERLNVVPPRVVMSVNRDGLDAVYHAASRTIALACARWQYVDVVAHELQHHLDEIVGQTLGGQKRGNHDPSFYQRLDDTRIDLGLPVLSQSH